jgi:hypothetical protein
MAHWDTDFEPELEVVATLRDQANRAAVEASEQYELLTEEVRKLAARGVSVDALSAATGFSPEAIRML